MKICRKCYRKNTGYESRAEKEMVEYLRKNDKIGPFIILEDRILKHQSCETRRRPDLLMSSPQKLHIIVECDERQHQSAQYSCETGRMDELADEFKEGHIVFIRWNPDHYKTPVKGAKKLVRKERLKALERLILDVAEGVDPLSIEYPLCCHYMFYNEDNDVISKRYPIKLHY
jgi:hypothetical protein